MSDLSPRDHDALAFIALWRMVTRAQLQRALFATVTPTVVKRCVDRLRFRRLVGAERIVRTGAQVLWCTATGRDYLLEHGAADASIFVARGPVAAKDFRHTAAIVDVAVSLTERGRAGTRLVPAWELQRRAAGALRAVPDILVVTASRPGSPGSVLAIEVDLATESLRLLVAKTTTLATWLATYASNSSLAILILTLGARRRAAAREAFARAGLRIRVVVDLLPAFTASSRHAAAADMSQPDFEDCSTEASTNLRGVASIPLPPVCVKQ